MDSYIGGMIEQNLTWLELSKLPNGARVMFTTSWDIFAENLIVPAGTHATVIENSLNEMQPVLFVRPDDEAVREKLKEWDGLIHINPFTGDFEEEGPLVAEGVT